MLEFHPNEIKPLTSGSTAIKSKNWDLNLSLCDSQAWSPTTMPLNPTTEKLLEQMAKCYCHEITNIPVLNVTSVPYMQA